MVTSSVARRNCCSKTDGKISLRAQSSLPAEMDLKGFRGASIAGPLAQNIASK
jgi:hypothetical protein